MYSVKEIYFTFQGEGYHTGRPAVFCRFSGCNLWSGREEDRANAVCKFCDTDFWGTDGVEGGKYSLEKLVEKCEQIWNKEFDQQPYIVFTGGEPALQLDEALIKALHAKNFEIAIETNGTLALPEDIDWICMSPKANTELVVKKGNELKLIYPQTGIDPKDVEHFDFEHYYLQPMDSPTQAENTMEVVKYCNLNPKWRISIQTHKLLNIP